MIRPATPSDLPRIFEIYKRARTYMAATGNPDQWGQVHPPENVLVNDVAEGTLYVYENAGKVHGVFLFLIGDDPTYGYIDGSWHSNTPYGVLHRVASSGEEKDVFGKIFAFARDRIAHLRIDTHEDNKVMQHVLAKYGFQECGTIYLEDGDPRLAYEIE